MKKNTKTIFKISNDAFRKIYNEFTFDENNEDYDDEMQNIIKAFNKLNPVDKIIIELYAETKSQRKTADILGVSRTTLIKVMNNIREKIIKNL